MGCCASKTKAATRNEKRGPHAALARNGEFEKIHVASLVADDTGTAKTQAIEENPDPSVADWPSRAVGNPFVASESYSESSSAKQRLTTHASFAVPISHGGCDLEGSHASLEVQVPLAVQQAFSLPRSALPPAIEGGMVTVAAAPCKDDTDGDDAGEEAAARAKACREECRLPDGRRMYTLPRSWSMSSASSSSDPLPCPPALLDASLPSSILSTESERNREVSFEYPRDGPSRLPSPPNVFMTLATAPIGPSSDAMWAQVGMDLMLLQAEEMHRQREAQGLDASLLSSLSALRPPEAFFGNGGTSGEHLRVRWVRASPAQMSSSGHSQVVFSPRAASPFARGVSPSSAPPAPGYDAFGDSATSIAHDFAPTDLVSSSTTLSMLQAEGTTSLQLPQITRLSASGL
jgi:hypothetical protein